MDKEEEPHHLELQLRGDNYADVVKLNSATKEGLDPLVIVGEGEWSWERYTFDNDDGDGYIDVRSDLIVKRIYSYTPTQAPKPDHVDDLEEAFNQLPEPDDALHRQERDPER